MERHALQSTPDIPDTVLAAAEVIWRYLHLGHKPIPADVIIALGTNDLRVADFAAELYHQGFGKLLVCTGAIAHHGDLLETPWDRSEAEMYAEVAVRKGVPREYILLETQANNTSANIRLSRTLLAAKGIQPANVVLAVKPFMQRRTWASMAVEWPEMPATVASPSMTLSEYFTEYLTPDRIVNIMMGDLQRIWIYGRKGWASAQKLPEEVLAAYRDLKRAGYTKHLLVEEP